MSACCSSEALSAVVARSPQRPPLCLTAASPCARLAAEKGETGYKLGEYGAGTYLEIHASVGSRVEEAMYTMTSPPAWDYQLSPFASSSPSVRATCPSSRRPSTARSGGRRASQRRRSSSSQSNRMGNTDYRSSPPTDSRTVRHVLLAGRARALLEACLWWLTRPTTRTPVDIYIRASAGRHRSAGSGPASAAANSSNNTSGLEMLVLSSQDAQPSSSRRCSLFEMSATTGSTVAASTPPPSSCTFSPVPPPQPETSPSPLQILAAAGVSVAGLCLTGVSVSTKAFRALADAGEGHNVRGPISSLGGGNRSNTHRRRSSATSVALPSPIVSATSPNTVTTATTPLMALSLSLMPAVPLYLVERLATLRTLSLSLAGGVCSREIFTLPLLECLSLSDFAGKLPDLAREDGKAFVNSLREVRLTEASGITDVDCLVHSPRLEAVELARCPVLASAAGALASPLLQILRVSHCPGLVEMTRRGSYAKGRSGRVAVVFSEDDATMHGETLSSNSIRTTSGSPLAQLRELHVVECGALAELPIVSTSSGLPRLQRVDFSRCAALRLPLSLLTLCQNLSELCLDGTAIERISTNIFGRVDHSNSENYGNSAAAVEEEAPVPFLRSISLRRCRSLADVSGLGRVAPRLTHADLSESAVETVGSFLSRDAAHLQELRLRLCLHLTTLCDGGAPDSTASVAPRAPASSLLLAPALRVLDLYHSGVSSLAGLAGCPCLESLNVNGCAALQSLRGVAGALQLRYLDAGGSGVADLTGLHRCPLLDTLLLYECAECVSVSALAGAPALRVLDVSGSAVGDCEGLGSCPRLRCLLAADCRRLRSLGGLEGAPVLREVDVSGTPLQSLRPLRRCPALRRLNVCRCGRLKHAHTGLEEVVIIE